jgi:hypothetical protein
MITEAYISSVAFGEGPSAGMSLVKDHNGNQYDTTSLYVAVGDSPQQFYNGLLIQFGGAGFSVASVSSGSAAGASGAAFTPPMIWGITLQSASLPQFYLNYGTPVTTTLDIPAQGNYYIMFGSSPGGSGLVVNWVRARAYPPGGIMPSVVFGKVI